MTIPTISDDARERTRAALDAKAALRLGIDPRPGRRVALRVVSRGTHAIAGHYLVAGEQTIDCHEADVDAFAREVERATPDEIARVTAEQTARAEEADKARREGGRFKPTSWEACYTAVLRRACSPIVSVEVLDAEPPASPPAKRGART